MSPKLLRVLQEGEFERVGGNRTLKVNVRLVTATNRNLEDFVAKGTFRADLYYRISVVSIFVPPLRDRRSDIPLLAADLTRKIRPPTRCPPQPLRCLCRATSLAMCANWITAFVVQRRWHRATRSATPILLVVTTNAFRRFCGKSQLRRRRTWRCRYRSSQRLPVPEQHRRQLSRSPTHH